MQIYKDYLAFQKYLCIFYVFMKYLLCFSVHIYPKTQIHIKYTIRKTYIPCIYVYVFLCIYVYVFTYTYVYIYIYNTCVFMYFMNTHYVSVYIDTRVHNRNGNIVKCSHNHA